MTKTTNLTLRSLYLLSPDLADDFRQQLEAAVNDCKQRPSLATKRQISLKIENHAASERSGRRGDSADPDRENAGAEARRDSGPSHAEEPTPVRLRRGGTVKVSAWKNIDVECEVDVSLDECISELLLIASEEGMPRRKIQAIDGATKILERITPDMVAEILAANPKATGLIRQRLQQWIDATEAQSSAA